MRLFISNIAIVASQAAKLVLHIPFVNFVNGRRGIYQLKEIFSRSQGASLKKFHLGKCTKFRTMSHLNMIIFNRLSIVRFSTNKIKFVVLKILFTTEINILLFEKIQNTTKVEKYC